MDVSKAQAIVDNCAGYVATVDNTSALDIYNGALKLDGDFTAEQLKALVFLMEQRDVEERRAKALETLKDVLVISRVGDDDSAPWISDDGTVGVDADLNREQLLALIFFIDNRNTHPKEQQVDEVVIDRSNKRIEPGVYKHYKRGRFVVLGVARNCKTEEEVVVFYNEEDMASMWIRPLDEFTSPAELDGVQVPRFVKQGVVLPA